MGRPTRLIPIISPSASLRRTATATSTPSWPAPRQGNVIGHGALYRSSPYHPNLYEIGQYIIHRDYRTTFAAYKINEYIARELIQKVRPDGVFGEAVCNLVVTQKSSYLIGMKDVAVEIDLMPAAAYEKAKSAPGRVTCLILYLPFGDGLREAFIPAVYRREIEVDRDRRGPGKKG